MESQRLVAVILTFNEEANLPGCLASLQALQCPVFLVDSGSTDRTRDIAAQFGAQVLEHPFQSHTTQWRWAMENVPCPAEWVLALDADQSLSPEVAAEIRTAVAAGQNDIHGYYINRRQIFRGKWIRHGGYNPKYLLKLFRRDSVQFDPRDLVDHHFYVSGKTEKFRHDLFERNSKEDDICFWLEKHVRYARLLAKEELLRREEAAAPISATPFGSPDQRSLWAKDLWYKLPLYWRPFLYFFYRYFGRLGILDGKTGFIFHFLQAFWFRLVIDISLEEQLTKRTEGRKREQLQAASYD
jgi:glycosyltransferase involved in cell wall biosynthesis